MTFVAFLVLNSVFSFWNGEFSLTSGLFRNTFDRFCFNTTKIYLYCLLAGWKQIHDWRKHEYRNPALWFLNKFYSFLSSIVMLQNICQCAGVWKFLVVKIIQISRRLLTKDGKIVRLDIWRRCNLKILLTLYHIIFYMQKCRVFRLITIICI